MKILLITQNFYPELGSASNRLTSIFKLLKKKVPDTYVLTTTPSYPNKNIFKKDVYYNDKDLNNLEEKNIFRLKTILEKQNSSLILRIFYYLEESIRLKLFLFKHGNKFDYIYVTTPNIFLAWTTLFFRNKNKEYILEIRDLWPDSVQKIGRLKINFAMPFLKYLEKKMYNSADKIIINNKYFYDKINHKLNRKVPIFYLPNSIQKSELIYPVTKKDFSVIYTGNLGHAQDVEKIIKIAQLLDSKEICFNVISYGAFNTYFKEQVNGLNYVKVLNPMTRNECLREISLASVSLSILKTNEIFLNVFPGKVVDAICMGTIPITNISGYTNKEITENNIGFANVKDEKSIVEKIIYLKDNSDCKIKMSNNALNYGYQNFIWENNIKQLTEFLFEE